jgi:hypothetical protein
MSKTVCVHCLLDSCRKLPCIGVHFAPPQKSYLRQFVRLSEKYASVIKRYWEYDIHHGTGQKMRDLMFNTFGVSFVVDALALIPSSQHLKVELLEPFLLPDGVDFTTGLILNADESPEPEDEIPIFPPRLWEQLFYPRSLRRLCDMSKFWSLYVRQNFTYYRNVSHESWTYPQFRVDEPLLASTAPGIYEDRTWSLPIIRYQRGMSGMYYWSLPENPDRKFCGTFFYLEPDSDAHLKTSRLVVAKNKFHACRLVGVPLSEIQAIYAQKLTGASFDTMVKFIFIELFEEDWMQESARDEPLLSYPKQRQRLQELMGILYTGEMTDENRAAGWKYDFDAHYRELYALEDALDQSLCLRARASGLDTILLTQMTGSTRLVSEVLDMRERKAIFENMWLMRGPETLETLML